MGKKKRSTRSTPNQRKKHAAEEATAWLFEKPGVVVRRNARLPARDASRQPREIDVLVNRGDGGELGAVVECKNEGKPVGVERLDAFVGKLGNLGIPPERGVYVSTSGYTRGAIARALADSVRPLVLSGLAADRLGGEGCEARQSLVYLLLEVERIGVVGVGRPDAEPREAFAFWDEHGDYAAPPDLIWRRWLAGDPPSYLGRYDLTLDVPTGWRWMAGEGARPDAITARVRVVAPVVSITGRAKRHALTDASTGEVDRFRIGAEFNPLGRTHPVVVARSEAELKHLLAHPASLRLSVERERLPRIRWKTSYWPPSQRVWSEFAEQRRAQDAVGEANPTAPSASPALDLEGSDLKTMWEPIQQRRPWDIDC